MTHSRSISRAAFTLIEVALASAILAVGFVGMIEALAVGSEMLDTARKQTIAAQVIECEVEYLRMQNWATISGLISSNPDYLGNYTEFSSTGLATGPGKWFKFSRQVVSPDPHPNLREVTMTVSWTSITGKPHSRSCSAYIGRYGLNATYQRP